MDELGFNKIAGAILATGLGVMALINAPKVFIKDHYPSTPAYSVGPIEAPAEGDAKPLPFPQADWVAAMDADKGAKVFKKCVSCHTADDGGKNGTGPNLYNIVGAAAGAKAGFGYSGAMSGSGITWSYEELDGFLKKPSKYLKGTKMSFIGLKKPADRAAVIEYLRLSSGAPVAAPTPAASEAMAPIETDGAVMEAGAKDTSGALVGTVKEKASAVIQVPTEKADAMIEGVKDKAGAMVEGGDKMIAGAKDKASAIVDGAAGKADAMVDGAKDAADAMVDGAKDKAGAMVDGAKDAADAMVDGAKDKAGSALSGAKDAAGDKMNALKDTVKDTAKDAADGK